MLFYGEIPERILNLAVANRIFLWNSKLTKEGIESCISIKDFKKLRHIVRGSGIKFKIIKKQGFPFKTAKNRKRLGLVLGAVLFVAFLGFMSRHIWIIDVTGNKRVSDTEIISALKEIGIQEGIKTSKINAKTEREKLLLKIDSLAWASLNIEGCKLTVNVSEIKNEKPNDSNSNNLIASQDGIIEKIDVTSGNCIVKKGDTVKKGDLLVSGIIEMQSGTRFVRSAGKVIASTERSVTVSGKYKQKIKSENGKTKKKCVLEFFALKIPLYLGSESEDYISYSKTKELSLFGQKIPVSLHKKEFRFTEEYTVTYNRQKLEEKLHEEIDRKLKKQGVKEYTVSEKKVAQTSDGITLTEIITSRENIAVSEDLIISEGV